MSSFPPSSSSSKHVGIANLGNTCFLNSVLQALRIIPPLLQELREAPLRPLREGSRKIALAQAFQQLLHEMCSPGGQPVLVPASFVRTLAQTCKTCDDDWFQPRQQADAAECLQYMLDALHDAVYRPVHITIQGQAKNKEQESQLRSLESWATFFRKEYSPIVKHFYGQNQIRVQCSQCKTVTERYEPWMMAKVPIPGGETVGSTVPSMVDCLSALHQPEMLDDYACDTCKSPQKAVIHTRISKLPNILILVLKRFTNTGQKIRGLVDWDLSALDFKPWMAFERCPFRETPTSAESVYETFAVIEHNGSSQSGHYHTYSRSSDGVWMDFDDESIQSVSSTVSSSTRGAVVSPDSYILFLSPVHVRKS